MIRQNAILPKIHSFKFMIRRITILPKICSVEFMIRQIHDLSQLNLPNLIFGKNGDSTYHEFGKTEIRPIVDLV